jgi:hypothetical protein
MAQAHPADEGDPPRVREINQRVFQFCVSPIGKVKLTGRLESRLTQPDIMLSRLLSEHQQCAKLTSAILTIVESGMYVEMLTS